MVLHYPGVSEENYFCIDVLIKLNQICFILLLYSFINQLESLKIANELPIMVTFGIYIGKLY